MNRFLRRFTLLTSVTLLAACAGFGPEIGDDGLTAEERRLRGIESGLAELNRRLENISEAQMQQGGPMAMANEIRSLRGEIERLTFELERDAQRNRSLYQDLDRRLSQVEGGGSASSGGAAVQVVAAASPDEEKAYLAAFELLRNGRYDDAILGFEHLLKNWPDGAHAANALYWSGEAHYIKRDYEKALQSFLPLIERFPDSSRRPDAMYKAGYAYAELGRTADARKVLQQVIAEHGDHNAANLARQRLERLGAK